MQPDVSDIHSELPLHSYIWKIASRCNLNCTYCFVYNSADQSYTRQPAFMSEDIVRSASSRLRDYLAARQINKSHIVFHGGEPMLGGRKHLARIVEIIDQELPPSEFSITLAMQTNLLLFTEEIGELLLSRDIQLGVSVDGPPKVNDLFRVDHQGRPSSAKLENKLQLVTSKPFRKIFSGFLCVFNIDTDPIETVDYLASWNPPMIDFLFPLHNHANPPAGRSDISNVPHGEWLCKAFDRTLELRKRPQIRIFDSIVRLMMGRLSLVESFGLHPNSLVVVETNGDIEAVDTLKSTYEGASHLGLNVLSHSFNDVHRHDMIRKRRGGIASLCPTCQACDLVRVCGGGYFPHRYSAKNGFENPSVYCKDIELLIRHIYTRILSEIDNGSKRAADKV